MCNRRQLFRLTVVSILALLLSPLAGSAFEIIRHAAEPDRASRQIRFSVTFDRSPDFFKTDELEHPRHSFQYWYDSDIGGDEFAGEDVAVIRGPEIRFDNVIPVRDSINPSGEKFPHAEGWGRSRGAVSFDLDDETIEFSVPWTLLGESDNQFSYRLFAFEFGELSSEVSAVLVPLPSPIWIGFILGLAAAFALWRRSFR